MRSNKSLAIGFLTLAGLGLLPARTWTSADGTKTFEGEFESYDAAAGKVTVRRGGQATSFGVDKLSEADREWLKDKAAEIAEEAEAEKDTDAFVSSPLGKALKKTKILSGARFSKHDITGNPEYFILYYSASW